MSKEAIDALIAAAEEMDLARKQSRKPSHLNQRLNAAAGQAARAVVAMVDTGNNRCWPMGPWILDAMRNPGNPNREPAVLTVGGKRYLMQTQEFGSGCDLDGAIRDDTAVELWATSIAPWLQGQARLKRSGAGYHDFFRVVKSPEGLACEADAMDTDDLLNHLANRAADWIIAIQAAIQIANRTPEKERDEWIVARLRSGATVPQVTSELEQKAQDGNAAWKPIKDRQIRTIAKQNGIRLSRGAPKKPH